jgi:hypothetical protein
MAYFYTLNNIRLNANQGMSVSSGSFGQQVADGARDRRLHPFPSDDPYNMPLGVNVMYGDSNTDTPTVQMRRGGGDVNVNQGYGMPVHLGSPSDPMANIRLRQDGDPNIGVPHQIDGWGVRSYVSAEDGGQSLNVNLSTDIPTVIPPTGFGDRRMNLAMQNELIETWKFQRSETNPDTQSIAQKIVRNRLDRYCFGRSEGSTVGTKVHINHPLQNRHGTRAYGGSAIAGLMREHEIAAILAGATHIPHALTIQVKGAEHLAGFRQGDPNSPAWDWPFLFPATFNDFGGSPTTKYGPRFGWGSDKTDAEYGSIRMGMRFALDPTIVTETWIQANAPSDTPQMKLVQAALARTMRDYGVIVSDDGPSWCQIHGQAFMNEEYAVMLRAIPRVGSNPGGFRWLRPHLRRVIGRRPNGTTVQVPQQSHWEEWAAGQQGWGGGMPRVPYSPPLAPL